jgi:hypothetical protein
MAAPTDTTSNGQVPSNLSFNLRLGGIDPG